MTDEADMNASAAPTWLASVFKPLMQTAGAPWRLFASYRPVWLGSDLFASLTVAMVALPQSMAFAQVAGLGPEVGLYTMIVAAVVAGLFTSSRQVSIGPTNTMAIMGGSALLVMAGSSDTINASHRVAFIGGVALLAGLMQIGLALTRLGELVRYVSRSVIVGFSAGAGVLIAVSQSSVFLGIALDNTETRLHGLPKTVVQFIETAGTPNGHALAVGVVSLAVALICRRVSKWLPAHLLAIIAGGCIVWWMGWDARTLDLVGELPAGLPGVQLPPMEPAFFGQMVVPALAIAMVGMIETYGIGKTLAGQTGETIKANQEFVALGITNIAASLFKGMPISASYSRSALNADAGARSSLACVLSGVFTAVVFLTLAPAAKYIPMASIAAILFVIAAGLVNWRYARRLIKSNNADLAVCIGTFAATLLFPLQQAVFVGVFLNIALYLRRARQVYVLEMVRDEGSPTGLIERPLRNEDHEGGVVFLQLEGNLFFAAADELQGRFDQVMSSGAKAVILRLKRTHMVDATVMNVIQQFAQQMKEHDGHVILCGVRERMKQRMIEFGLTDTIPADQIFTTGDDLFASAKSAIHCAKTLTGKDLSQSSGNHRKHPDAWNYEI